MLPDNARVIAVTGSRSRSSSQGQRVVCLLVLESKIGNLPQGAIFRMSRTAFVELLDLPKFGYSGAIDHGRPSPPEFPVLILPQGDSKAPGASSSELIMASKKQCPLVQEAAKPALELMPAPRSARDVAMLLQYAACL